MISICINTWKPAAWFCLACGLLWGAAGCGATTGEESVPAPTAPPPTASAEAPAEPPTATLPPAGIPAGGTPTGAAQPISSGLAGLVFSASDVSGQPDTPLPGQALIAIPAADAADTLGLSGSPTDDELRFLKTAIQSPDSQVAAVVTDAQGRYRLALPPGDYILCVGEEETAAPVRFPVSTRGCGRVTVPAEGGKTVDVSSGFGEILLVEP